MPQTDNTEEQKGLTQDEFDQKLEDELNNLQQCQKSKALSSCLSCQEIIGCETRGAYILAVYQSMNKGQGGGFEF